jgi:hypothetical protein
LNQQKGILMSLNTDSSQEGFIDRRQTVAAPGSLVERRQFGNSHARLSPDARELAEAIDRYKVQHRRRFITSEEMLNVIASLGYRKSPI